MSSISNNQHYPNLCVKAATDPETFNTFKCHPVYNEILEHVSYQEGVEYIKYIKNETILNNIEKFRANDTIGTPLTYNYAGCIGTFSPTTLRYIKVLNDISTLNLNEFNIVEIGGGYGGQYTVLRQLFKPKHYTFVDLPQVNKLTCKYISSLKLDDINISYIDGTENFNEMTPDLVISNYAFSECSATVQDVYISKIINNTKHCYMIYNNQLGYTHTEFATKINNHKVTISSELPQTHPNNVLITW
jgi:putative sugar O-methyltransferase